MKIVTIFSRQIVSDENAILAFHRCVLYALIQMGFERLRSPRQSNTTGRFESRPQISLRLDFDFRHSHYTAEVFCTFVLRACVQSGLQKLRNQSMGSWRLCHCVVPICFHIGDL